MSRDTDTQTWILNPLVTKINIFVFFVRAVIILVGSLLESQTRAINNISKIDLHYQNRSWCFWLCCMKHSRKNFRLFSWNCGQCRSWNKSQKSALGSLAVFASRDHLFGAREEERSSTAQIISAEGENLVESAGSPLPSMIAGMPSQPDSDAIGTSSNRRAYARRKYSFSSTFRFIVVPISLPCLEHRRARANERSAWRWSWTRSSHAWRDEGMQDDIAGDQLSQATNWKCKVTYTHGAWRRK